MFSSIKNALLDRTNRSREEAERKEESTPANDVVERLDECGDVEVVECASNIDELSPPPESGTNNDTSSHESPEQDADRESWRFVQCDSLDVAYETS